APAPARTATPTATQTRTATPTQTQTSRNSPQIDLTQEQAVTLVNRWLSSKGRIFAAPFDLQLVRQYTSGPLYKNITQPNGSIDWLRKNNSYYTYRESKVINVVSFSVSGSRPELIVTVYEDRTFHTPRGIDSRLSGASKGNYRYWFVKDNGRWKIYERQAVN
ncbi:ARC6/PARC6 family protein, partial [Limnoraphis robusta]|nr:ARC6/PARC6 family protein [Limnoraphis robusta]